MKINTSLSVLSALGVLVDPTTTGVQGSERAMTYDEPSGGEGQLNFN